MLFRSRPGGGEPADCQKQQRYSDAGPAGNETCYRDEYRLQRYACRAPERERRQVSGGTSDSRDHTHDCLEAS